MILCSICKIAAGSSPLKVFEQLHGVPQGWSQLGRPSASKIFQLRIALEQPNHDLFEQKLFTISTPDHQDYGKHLTREEVKELIKPRDESTEAVLSWLENSGISSSAITNDGEWINFRTSVRQAEQMLNTTFYYFAHQSNSRSKLLRTLQYSVPENLTNHITMIQSTTRFGQIKAHNSQLFRIGSASSVSAAVDAACNTTMTPSCLRDLYNIGNYTAKPDPKSRFGVCGYLNQYAKYDALDVFLKKYAPYALSQNFSYALINGGLDTQNSTLSDVEANLDIQYAASIGYKSNITYYSTGGLGFLVPDLDQPDQSDNQNEPYLDFLKYALALPDNELPQTITTSYGEDEQSVPESYSKVVCKMFGQLGLRGVSVLFSSGDTGVGSACQTNDGKNTMRFLPIFPAACPYVTSVGATRYVEPESAVFFSSGGFSDRFPRPAYQDDAVKGYLHILGDRWKGLYNPAGRGFPDVAAQGFNYHIIDKNSTTGVFADRTASGTSCSSPTFAAIISLLNNARLSAGKRPLGFLNPWLYSQGKQGLNDIVHGGSRGCTGKDQYSGLPTPFVPYASWNATAGWDPVTGLGTPDFGKLLGLVKGY
ncbi:tripeptidyl peptidase sed3 protein [Rutstroemia sp. NJR-2017a BVV2]|nr:tripeptidyl peptidase sed3 protein [Rutstroemia sp. NJR-2017a BVV2]